MKFLLVHYHPNHCQQGSRFSLFLTKSTTFHQQSCRFLCSRLVPHSLSHIPPPSPPPQVLEAKLLVFCQFQPGKASLLTKWRRRVLGRYLPGKSSGMNATDTLFSPQALTVVQDQFFNCLWSISSTPKWLFLMILSSFMFTFCRGELPASSSHYY